MSNVCTDCESEFTTQGYILTVTTKNRPRAPETGAPINRRTAARERRYSRT